MFSVVFLQDSKIWVELVWFAVWICEIGIVIGVLLECDFSGLRRPLTWEKARNPIGALIVAASVLLAHLAGTALDAMLRSQDTAAIERVLTDFEHRLAELEAKAGAHAPAQK